MFATKGFRILVVVVVLLCGGLFAFTFFRDSTTLSFRVLLDGKPIPIGATPKVLVDGLPFTSGCTISVGPHRLSVELPNAEPLEQRIWAFWGDKSLGELPLESSKGSLLVTVTPSPASVIVRRGAEVVSKGDAPLTVGKLPFGDYQLEIIRGEYKETHSAKIQSKPRTEAKVDLNLGSVNLSSDPPDAEFELSGDGRHWKDKLPIKIDDVPGGNYSLVVSRKGWVLKKEISVSRGVVATNKTEFQYGSIEVTSEPAGLAISIDGTEIGKTPLTLQERKHGEYTMTASDGENDLKATISVAPKQAAKYAFVFDYSGVQLSSTPAGATVIRNGKTIGKTPLVINHILVGDTTIELKLEGYSSKMVPIAIVKGTTAKSETKLVSVAYTEALRRAQAHFDSRDYPLALKEIEAISLAEKTEGEEALALRKKIDYEMSLASAKKSLSDENYMQAQESLNSAQKSFGCTTEIQELTTKLVQMKITKVDSLLRDAADEIGRGNFSKSSAILDKAKQLIPDYPKLIEAQAKLASILQGRKEKQFQNVIEEANSSLNAKRYADFLDELKKAEDIFPKHAKVKELQARKAELFDLSTPRGIVLRATTREDGRQKWGQVKRLLQRWEFVRYNEEKEAQARGTRTVELRKPDYYVAKTDIQDVRPGGGRTSTVKLFGVPIQVTDTSTGKFAPASLTQKFSEEINGHDGYTVMNGVKTPLSVEKMNDLLQFTGLPVAHEILDVVDKFSIESTNSGQMVLIRDLGSNIQKCIFDRQSGLMLSSQTFENKRGTLKLLSQWDYQNYKTFEGITVPTKIIITTDGKQMEKNLIKQFYGF